MAARCGFPASESRRLTDGPRLDPPYGQAKNSTTRSKVSTRVAINGFGRVGRALLRSAHESAAGIEIVAINDVTDAATLAALLRHDSVYGRFPGSIGSTEDAISVDGVHIPVLSEHDPEDLPWGELGVDVAIESTGRFRTRAGAAKHLTAGARQGDHLGPCKGQRARGCRPRAGRELRPGVRPGAPPHRDQRVLHHELPGPVAKVLHESLGIRHGLMTTVHAYTSDQNLLDGPHKDLRRARAGAINIIPTSTGAAKALGHVIPELEGKLHGYAVRVPLPTGSLVDLTIETTRPTSVDEVNGAFRESADSGELEGILAYSEEPMVATDIIGSPYSAVFDAPLTSVIDETQVKVVAWYDNEWGYSTRLVELAERVALPVSARS